MSKRIAANVFTYDLALVSPFKYCLECSRQDTMSKTFDTHQELHLRENSCSTTCINLLCKKSVAVATNTSLPFCSTSYANNNPFKLPVVEGTSRMWRTKKVCIYRCRSMVLIPICVHLFCPAWHLISIIIIIYQSTSLKYMQNCQNIFRTCEISSSCDFLLFSSCTKNFLI